MKRNNRIRLRGLDNRDPGCIEKEHEITIEFLRLVNESTSTHSLIRAVTTFFQRQSGCQAVGVRLRDGDDYPYFEARGFPEEFLLVENSLCGRDPLGNVLRDPCGKPVIECMCGNVICGRFDPSKPFFTPHGTFWTNCTSELLASTGEADRLTRTRNRCNSSGYESVALIPLHIGEERLGLLQLNDRRKDVFSRETIGLWEQLADQLSVALAKIRAEEAAKLKNNELERLNRTLKALRDSSQAVSCALDEAGFLDAICRIIVEDCGHKMVWIGFAEENERKTIRPVAHAGFEEGYLESLSLTWANCERGRGPTGTAIRKGRPIACRDMLDDPQFAPWREEAIKHGYASSLALPLMDGGRAFGALTIYAQDPDPFSIEEVRLLSELAADLAYGIATIRLRIAHAQAQELLRKSGERYRSLVELSPNPIFINRGDRIEYVNPATVDLFGATSAEQLLGRSPLDLFHPDYHSLIRTRIGQLLEGRAVPNIEEKIVRLDGQVRDVEVVASAFVDRQGPAIQAILHDITNRKRAEEQMRLHLTILESTANAIVIADRNGIIQWINPAFTKLTGFASAEIVGRNPRLLKSGLHEPRFYQTMWETILAGQVWHGELINRRKDGTHYFEEMTITPVIDAQGKITHFIAIMHDVSERKKLENRLRTAKEAAEAANKAKDHFLANISHELRTPMNAILGMTELVLSEELPPTVHDCLETAKESADVLLELLNEILDFSRIEAAQFLLDTVPFSLRQMLSHTLKALGVRAYEKGLELVCDLPEDVPDRLLGDSLRIRQVLTNLIGNAIKFTARGEIVVSVAEIPLGEGEASAEPWKTRIANASASAPQTPRPSQTLSNGNGHAKGDSRSPATYRRPTIERQERSAAKDIETDEILLKFTVEDTGIGIPLEMQSRIFAPFTQADTSLTRRYGGTGLGLAIASGLVKLMGGRIWVESRPGCGSVFSFTVRIKKSSPSTTGMAAIRTGQDRLQGLPVLLVAENPTVRRILHMILFRWGLNPETLGDMAAALTAINNAAAKGIAFPLALIDVSLPKTDGYAFAKWIQCHPGSVGATILMVSPCEGTENLRRCQELGVRYLEKPILPSKLLNAISQTLGMDLMASSIPLAPPRTPESTLAQRPLRVLVVEDNLANQKVVSRILEKFGHEPVVASNGLEGLDRLRESHFNVVLMDIQMPIMDGYQATTAIRALPDPEKARIPIVALTAHARKWDEQHCFAAGMDAYLNKPIAAKKLIDILERLTNRSASMSMPESESASSELEREIPAPVALSNGVFDLQEALSRCFDREMFEQMRDFFFAQSPEILDQIRCALARGETEEIARKAHALKGTVVYLGSRCSVEAIDKVEKACRSGDLTSAHRLVDCLAAQIELLKKALVSSVGLES